jgi:hypothetical protein
MRIKRLLVSIGIGLALTAALLACINGVGVPVVRASEAAAPDRQVTSTLVTFESAAFIGSYKLDDASCTFDVSDHEIDLTCEGQVNSNFGTPDWEIEVCSGEQQASVDSIIMSSYASGDINNDAAALPWNEWSPWCSTSGDLTQLAPAAGRERWEFSNDTADYCTICKTVEFEVDTDPDKHEQVEISLNWRLEEIDGVEIDHSPGPTGCVPIEDVTLHGPATATVGTPVWFESELTPVSPTRPISWSFDVTYGPDQQVKTVSGRSSGRVQATWYNTGTKTITVTASNCEGYGYATDSTTITLDHKYQWTPPFSVTVPGKPVLDCTHCPAPEWGFWQIGHWIDWLWCNLKCWFEYFLEFLYWLWKMLYATLSSMINAFMEQFWIGVNNLLLMIDYHGERIAVNIEAFFEEIAEFARDLVFEVRDWIAELLTRLASWIEENSDEIGDSLQQYINEIRDWLYDGLTEIAEVLDGWGDFGSWMADNTRSFRDWAYEELTDLAQFFQGWNNEIGDFLSNATTEFRDWLYDLLTELVLFWDGWAEFFYTAADRVRRFRDWLYDWMTELGEWINATVTNAGAFVADVVRDYRDWLYDILTWYGNFVYGNITGIGEYLANSVRRLAKLLQILVLTWANVVSALAIFALAILDVIDLVIEKAVDGLGILIYVSGLTGDLVTGLRDAINSSSTADIYQDVPGLYYFWRGMTFFEDTVGSSPLAVLNLVAIGIIGINLSLWTVGQVGDLIEDVARF